MTTPSGSRNQAIVVTADRKATEAGIKIIVSGGNAADAAVAANAVMGVVAPQTCGVGGDLFALIYPADSSSGTRHPKALAAAGRAGSQVNPQLLNEVSAQRDRVLHPHTVTVPGMVYGWQRLLDTYGSGMSWTEILGPAISLAEDGFAVSSELSQALTDRFELLCHQPSAVGLFLQDRPPDPDEWVRRPGLAKTLSLIASTGAEGFYQGEPGSNIIQSLDGLFSHQDLATDQSEWTEPLGLELFGATGWTVPPPSQGYLTLGTLAIYELLGAPSLRTYTGWLALIEAYRILAAERDLVLADPEVMTETGAELLTKQRLQKYSERVDVGRVGQWGPPPETTIGTTHLSITDTAGMALSLTQSNFWGMGTAIGAGDSGFWLHNRGAGFSLHPHSPNLMAPHRRPLHTLSPTLWTKADNLFMVLGTRGGHSQPQLLAQVAARILCDQQSPEQAQAAPRLTLPYPWEEPARHLDVETALPSEIKSGLETTGWELREHPAQPGWGPVAMIAPKPTGRMVGAADPRVETAWAETVELEVQGDQPLILEREE